MKNKIWRSHRPRVLKAWALTRKQRVLLFLFVWLVFVLLDLRFSFDFVGFHLIVGLALLLSVILLVAGTISCVVGRDGSLLKLGGWLFLLVLTDIWAVGVISAIQDRRSRIRAQPIVAAVETFHAEKGAYPVSLEDLRPAYIARIPRNCMGWFGTEFHYRRAKDSYVIVFPLPHGYRRVYFGDRGVWEGRD
jgi:hypothetical protein